MTPEQLQALMSWAGVNAKANISGELRHTEEEARAMLYAAFGFDMGEYGQPIAPKPAPVEERRVWQHRIHTACGSACKFGVVDNHGTWWHEQRSGHVYLWTTLSCRAARRKASELNARETA